VTAMRRDERRDRPLRLFRQRTRAGRTVASRDQCEHLEAAPSGITTTKTACEDHTPEDGTTVHLRICLACEHVACCDSSPAQHATAHYRATGHPVMQSAEPGESWRWCYVDEDLG